MLMLLTRIPFPFTLCPRQLLTTHREEKDEDKIPKIPNMENYRGKIHQSRYAIYGWNVSRHIGRKPFVLLGEGNIGMEIKIEYGAKWNWGGRDLCADIGRGTMNILPKVKRKIQIDATVTWQCDEQVFLLRQNWGSWGFMCGHWRATK